ncbi:hypothetical protein CRG98_024734 [Punica granatum]|uniref:Uncharacterized protein n=1 Tax=Punica granatum TaxID=22663 RepID=A0A2I0JF24_PUNGR|nr:hypothetical protein CRG98_024734 [Punica granatum]
MLYIPHSLDRTTLIGFLLRPNFANSDGFTKTIFEIQYEYSIEPHCARTPNNISNSRTASRLSNKPAVHVTLSIFLRASSLCRWILSIRQFAQTNLNSWSEMQTLVLQAICLSARAARLCSLQIIHCSPRSLFLETRRCSQTHDVHPLLLQIIHCSLRSPFLETRRRFQTHDVHPLLLQIIYCSLRSLFLKTRRRSQTHDVYPLLLLSLWTLHCLGFLNSIPIAPLRRNSNYYHGSKLRAAYIGRTGPDGESSAHGPVSRFSSPRPNERETRPESGIEGAHWAWLAQAWRDPAQPNSPGEDVKKTQGAKFL